MLDFMFVNALVWTAVVYIFAPILIFVMIKKTVVAYNKDAHREMWINGAVGAAGIVLMILALTIFNPENGFLQNAAQSAGDYINSQDISIVAPPR